MPTCVYCQLEKSVEGFTREHVVHRAFGGFEDNLTLAPLEKPAVCRDCNQFFGEGIDRQITRDSYEAFHRLFQGHRSLEAIRELFALRVRVSLPDDHELGPLQLELGPAVQDRPGLYLVPQVRFESEDGHWVCVKEAELATQNPVTDPSLRRDPVAIFSSFPDAEERLRAKLEALGLAPATWTRIEDMPEAGVREMELDVQGSVDADLGRAVAKIAFNYLTWAKGPAFVLRPDFDPVRRFIRYGLGAWRDFVELSAVPILIHDTESVRHTQGHLLTVGFTGGPHGRIAGRLIGQVSLYNTMTYRVRLCDRLSGLWEEVASGHHYNLETRRVERLGTTRLAIPAGVTPVNWR